MNIKPRKEALLRPHRKIYKYCARINYVVYTEIKEKNGKKYFYRVRTVRENKKFRKRRIYLGKDLSQKELLKAEEKADTKLNEKNKLEIIKKIAPAIIKILKRNNIKKAGIFGSYTRGEQKKNSDIDIVIEPPKEMGYGFVKIELELEDKLKKKVDLLSYRAIHPLLKKKILKEEIKLL